MSNTLENVVNAAAEVDPTAPVVEIAQAAIETAANPTSPSVILKDVELAISLVKELKAVLSTAHPSVSSLVKKLLFS